MSAKQRPCCSSLRVLNVWPSVTPGRLVSTFPPPLYGFLLPAWWTSAAWLHHGGLQGWAPNLQSFFSKIVTKDSILAWDSVLLKCCFWVDGLIYNLVNVSLCSPEMLYITFTVNPLHNTIIFLQNSRKRYPVTHPRGHGMYGDWTFRIIAIIWGNQLMTQNISP